MSSLQNRNGKLYAKLKDASGEWVRVRTGFTSDERAKAERWVRDREREIAREVARRGADGSPLTVRGYFEKWIEARRAAGLSDWMKDRGRMENHVLPKLGEMPIADVRGRHFVELAAEWRTKISEQTGDKLAPRMIHNVYGTVKAMFRDAELAELIDRSPCSLTDQQLGPRVDKDREWRETAVFSRAEAEEIISSPKIPLDRRVVYALELLAGIRPGEAAALRWRHYDAGRDPLGALLVAHAYSSTNAIEKGTKTGTVKHVPVHATLAAILAEWKLSGWSAMVGRAPEADDLIVPLPPADAKARTKRAELEPFRTFYYSGRRWRDEDQPALGWRTRRHYDMRATFITLALDDGADEYILETRVTHTKRSRSSFDGYNRGNQWAITCAEVAKLNLVRRTPTRDVVVLPVAANSSFGPTVVQGPDMSTIPDASKLRRRGLNILPPVSGNTRHERIPQVTAGAGSPNGAERGRLDQTVVQAVCDAAICALRASARLERRECVQEIDDTQAIVDAQREHEEIEIGHARVVGRHVRRLR